MSSDKISANLDTDGSGRILVSPDDAKSANQSAAAPNSMLRARSTDGDSSTSPSPPPNPPPRRECPSTPTKGSSQEKEVTFLKNRLLYRFEQRIKLRKEKDCDQRNGVNAEDSMSSQTKLSSTSSTPKMKTALTSGQLEQRISQNKSDTITMQSTRNCNNAENVDLEEGLAALPPNNHIGASSTTTFSAADDDPSSVGNNHVPMTMTTTTGTAPEVATDTSTATSTSSVTNNDCTEIINNNMSSLPLPMGMADSLALLTPPVPDAQIIVAHEQEMDEDEKRRKPDEAVLLTPPVPDAQIIVAHEQEIDEDEKRRKPDEVALLTPPVPDAQRIVAYEKKMDEDEKRLKPDLIQASKRGVWKKSAKGKPEMIVTQPQPLSSGAIEDVYNGPVDIDLHVSEEGREINGANLDEHDEGNPSINNHSNDEDDDDAVRRPVLDQDQPTSNDEWHENVLDRPSDSSTIVIPEAFLVEDSSSLSLRASVAQLIVPVPWYKQKKVILSACVSAFTVVGVVVPWMLAVSGGNQEWVGAVCQMKGDICSEGQACPSGTCCSQFGQCGITEDFCGKCCQGGDCWDALTLSTPINSSYTAEGDSRLIAYIGNWDECPNPAQIQRYSHIIISAAITYRWEPAKNICNEQCDIDAALGGLLSICGNENRQDLVDAWRDEGKKVIFSFGGSGMGDRYSQYQNNCWDYCFGKEEELTTNLTKIVKNQNFDGIEIDYPYCYDVKGKHHGRCMRRTDLYSDEKAQLFLSRITSKLRSKLDALPRLPTGQRHELSHNVFDDDFIEEESAYFKILHEHRADIEHLLVRFYSGVTLPAVDGLIFRESAPAHLLSAGEIYASIVNGIFDGNATKVVFGFCISDCSSSLSNVNSSEAVEILKDLKSYNDGAFACSGGAFFWRALNDQQSSWSSSVWDEIMLTSGCSID